MKNISLVLNGVLIVAVAVLYYLHFKKPVIEEKEIAPSIPVPVSGTAPSMVYVITDSLLNNYSYYKARKAEFEAKHERMQNDIKAESDRLQNDGADYQQKAGMMTDAERMKIEEQLMARQRKLEKKYSDMQESFDDEQAKFSEELHAKLTAYAKEFNKGKNYSFILAYQKGGGILLANDSLNVTTQMLEGLNKKEGSK